MNLRVCLLLPIGKSSHTSLFWENFHFADKQTKQIDELFTKQLNPENFSLPVFSFCLLTPDS